ncbi:cytochrome C556 [Rhizobium sp. Root274]|uniref:c-type cytochrome n=1 Tax=unclassified Rhizobium TaxID=2613769 RepID=UPI000715BD98|nr:MULTISPECIES: cytochrome c [unclassified Rhizobium]KQW31484.1 cytochrome C556 [Rhizobium sp. Root1240]KRD33026.1 cytochrome C556 [Rhizobium sp. Root274]
MNLKVVLSATVAICLGVSAAIAAGEPQTVRQELMKKAGASAGALGAIAKGEKPYDAEAVKTALTNLVEVGKTFPEHFPAGSETGLDTEASPKIWENMDDFKAKSAKLTSVAEAQLAAMPADQAAVGAALQAIGATCGDCHQTYRLKKN